MGNRDRIHHDQVTTGASAGWLFAALLPAVLCADTIHIVSNHKTGSGFCHGVAGLAQKEMGLHITCGDGNTHADAQTVHKLAPRGYVVNLVRNTYKLIQSYYG